MKPTRPFLRTETDSFAKAFPQVADLVVEVEHDPFRMELADNDWRKHMRMTVANIQPRIACMNRRCQRGGWDVQGLLDRLSLSRETHFEDTLACYGDEGSPQGRNKGRSCDHYIRVRIDITYRPDASQRADPEG